MVFKVLVLGRDLPLQTGFLNRVSGERVTNQLYNTLGVSLGIATNEGHKDVSTVLQLDIHEGSSGSYCYRKT